MFSKVDLVISDVVEYSTIAVLAPPAISPGSQNFSGTLAISVVAPAGTVIRYTLDGTDVQPNSPEWPGGVGSYTTLTLDQSCVLKVRYYDGDVGSQQVTQVYTLTGTSGTCGAVAITKVSGTLHQTPVTVAMSCATPSSTIQFTINGGGLTTYTLPVTLALDDEVIAYAFAAGLADSPESSFINDSYAP